MKKISKFLSILLCLSMLLSYMPSIARADDTTTVTVSIADYATANSWVNGTQYTTLSMDNVVTVTATGGNNTGKYYTSGNEWRMYQTESPSIVVSAAEGNTIVSVTISYNINKTGILTHNGSNIASGTTVSVNDSSVTFGVGNSATATNGQVKITSIEVVYSASSGDGSTNPPCAHSETTCIDNEDGTHNVVCASCNEVLTQNVAHEYNNYLCACGVTDLCESVVVTEPETGVAYKLGVLQENLDKYLFFTGKMSGYYYATTETAPLGVDVYLETTDGGYYVYFNDANGDKNYLYIVQSGTYINVKYGKDVTPSVFTWDSEYNTLVTPVGEETYFLGTYNTYSTLSASKYSYISGNFPSHLYILKDHTEHTTVDKYIADGLQMHCIQSICTVCKAVVSETYDSHSGLDGSCPCGIKASTISDVLGGTSGGSYVVRGQVTFVDGKNVFVQDDTGGINLYFSTAPSYNVGDEIMGMGTLGAYNGLPQLASATAVQISPSTYSVDAVTVKIGDLKDSHLCCKIIITNLEVTAVSSDNVTVTDGEKTINIYKGTFNNAVYVGDTIAEFTGVLGTYNNYQLRSNDTIVVTHTHVYVGTNCVNHGTCVCGAADPNLADHIFTNYVSDDNATCTEDGTKTASCENGCGKTDVITIEGSALGHSYTNYISNGDAKCGVNGTETATCDHGCGATDKVVDTGSALTHSYTNYVSNGDAKCGVNGTETATCDHGCGTKDTRTKENSALEHSYTDYKSNNDATCDVDGTKTASCDHGCGETKTVADEGSALGHNYSNYVSDGNATCTADGTKTSKCDRCDETSTVTDAGSAGHIDTVKDNLCDRCGVSLCAECIDVDTDKDHNCDVCGSKVGNHVYTTVVTDPTCTGKGYTTYTCNCGDTYTGNDVPALNHSYTDYKSNGDATCTEDGTKTAKCDRCDSTNTIADTGSALGHSYTNYKSNSDATCTADGTKTAKCDRCDSTSTVADTGSALGHDYEGIVTKEPTCTEDGVKTYTCKHDATHTYTEIVNALGHSLKKVEAVAATTEATGLKEHYKCETCGKLFSDDKGENEVTLADVTTDKLTPPADSDELTATLVSKDLGLENATDFTTETVGQITFTADVGENAYGNTPKYYNTGTAIRFYSQNTLTISAADGYTIKTITITTGSGNKMTTDNCGITNGTATGLDTTEVVITPADGTEDVVLTYLLGSGHWRIEAIDVAYEGASAGDDTTGGDNTPDDDVTIPTDPTPTDPTPTDPTPTDPTPDDDDTKPSDPEADSTLTIKEALELGASKDHNTYTENKYYVTGVIKNVYNTQYGNMIITDESGNELTIYGTYSADGEVRYDKLEVKPVAGDTVTVYGVIGQYNSTPQMKNGWIVKHEPAAKDDDNTDDTTTSTDPEAGSTLTIKEALELGASKDHNTYTEGKYYVTGVITEVYNTTYGNMKITDADGNILTIYGTYGADGEVRYDKLEVQPVAGDTVTVYGVIGQYNGVAQVKNGWIINHEPAEKEDDTTTPSEPTNPSEPTTPSEPTNPDDDSNVTTGITITFDDTSKRTSLSEDKQVWTENGIIVTNDKAESTTNVADYSNPARFYKFTTLTVAYESMASIQFHCNTEKYAEALEAALTGSDHSVVRDGKVVTVTLNAVADSFTVALTGGQVRMDSITVTTGTASDTDDDTGSTQPSTPADPTTPSEPSETTKPTEPSKPTETVKKASKVSKPVAGESYKLGYYQAALEKTLYFAGKMNGYYLATTDDLDEAVDVYVEKVSGGLRLYFLDGKTKTYIDIVPRDNDATKTNVILTTSPSAVYVWNETFGTFVTTVNGADWYLGTYGTYSTISASKTSYIEDTSKIGVSQFPVCCYTVKEVPKTGDSISMFVAMLAMSAIGIAIIGLKKKEF